ncbi:MAG: hypothetical protein WAT17_00340 [Candidatus Saccharimonadales bacterium]|jgi:hypothetical protein
MSELENTPHQAVTTLTDEQARRQLEFQTLVAEHIESHLKNGTLNAAVRHSLLDWTSVVAASSDEPISLSERFALAEPVIETDMRLSAHDIAKIHKIGGALLGEAIKI